MRRAVKNMMPKKKRGRPATGRDPLVALRLPTELIRELDGWCERAEVNRSEAIRRWVENGLMENPEAVGRWLRKAKNDLAGR